MKSFNHNLIEHNIILNATIVYAFENDDPIMVNIPKIRDSIEDPSFNLFLSLMILKKEDYEDMRLKSQVENETQALIALIRENKEVRLQIEPYIEKYIQGASVSSKGIQIGERVLTEKEVDFFKNIILVSFGIKRLEDIVEDKEEEDLLAKMSPAERIIYERQQETLKRLEQAKRKRDEAKGGSKIDLPKMIAGVMKEFNMSLDQIKDLNYYTLYYLFSYVFKIDHYDFMKKAAASGNLTKKAKIKHWLE